MRFYTGEYSNSVPGWGNAGWSSHGTWGPKSVPLKETILRPQPERTTPAAEFEQKRVLTARAVETAMAKIAELYAEQDMIMPNFGILIIEADKLLALSVNTGWEKRHFVEPSATYTGCFGPTYMEDNQAEELIHQALIQSRAPALNSAGNPKIIEPGAHFGSYRMEQMDWENMRDGAVLDSRNNTVYSVSGGEDVANLYVATTIAGYIAIGKAYAQGVIESTLT
ncbi:MAG: hypothetical protein V4702_00360 [Patescibacteria group bacterium]